MNKETWPPPPEGQRSVVEHIREAGIDIEICSDIINITFVPYRRYHLIVPAIIVLPSAADLLWDVFHARSLSGFLMTMGPYIPVFPILAGITYWLQYDYMMCRGLYSISDTGKILGRGSILKNSKGIEYVRVVPVSGLWAIRLGLADGEEGAAWWLRPWRCERNELPLPRTRSRAAVERLAKIIGDFLKVPVMVE